MSNTRVLIVDDSPLILEIIADTVRSTPGLELVGAARNGHEALRLAQSTRPDVITLDVQMPQLNGLETLERLLKERPVPVIMVSAQTQLGADVTLQALDLGAIDYVAKPGSGGDSKTWTTELARKIRTVVGVDVARILDIRRQRKPRPVKVGKTPATSPGDAREGAAFRQGCEGCCIAIGISTGGPPALTALFESIQPPQPPIVVVQHMPAAFTGPFANRLNQQSRLTIREARSGDLLEPNTVLIAPGGQHLHLEQRAGQVVARVTDGEPVSGHKPSVDVMMFDAARIFGPRCLGVIMTGMGRDGADGCRAIHQAGGYVLGQDAASSDVYGMNRAAFVEGSVHKQFHLDEVARVITQAAQRLKSASPTAIFS